MSGADRRAVLTGLAAAGLMGCSVRKEATAPIPAAPEVFDLSALERDHGGRLGFAARDTGTGRTLAWRGEERFVYCSTFKMYLAAATLIRVQNGQENLDRQVPITRADMINHAPVTEPAIGSTLSVEQLMKGTVEVSDNPAANILLKAMGGLEAMQAFYRSIGDTTTRVDRFEPEMNRLDGDKDTIQPFLAVLDPDQGGGRQVHLEGRAVDEPFFRSPDQGAARPGVTGDETQAAAVNTLQSRQVEDLGRRRRRGGLLARGAAHQA